MTMFVQKLPNSLSLVRKVLEADSPMPITFTEGEIYGPVSPTPVTAQGTLAVSATVDLVPGSTASNRFLTLLLQFSGATRPPLVQVTINKGIAGERSDYLFQGDEFNQNYLLKIYFSNATTNIEIVNSAENSALTVIGYNIEYGNEGIFLPKRKFIL